MIINQTINDIIKECDYYEDMIEKPSYFRKWIEDPDYTYNFLKKCRQLEEKKLYSHPLRSGSIHDIYSYKNIKPRIESFSDYKNNYIFLYIVVILIFIYYINNEFITNMWTS